MIFAKLRSMCNSSTKEYLMPEIHCLVLSSDMAETAIDQNQLNNPLLNVPNYWFNNLREGQQESNTCQLQGIWTKIQIPQIPPQSSFCANCETQLQKANSGAK